MIDLTTHIFLFALVALAIVMLSSFFSESEDGPALRGLPRRFAYFFFGVGLLTVLMLVVEHTFASVS